MSLTPCVLEPHARLMAAALVESQHESQQGELPEEEGLKPTPPPLALPEAAGDTPKPPWHVINTVQPGIDGDHVDWVQTARDAEEYLTQGL